jgi:glycosyl transferase, family 25
MQTFMIYWINLERDVDRRAWMESQLDRLGLPACRVPALTPATLPPWIAERFLPEASHLVLPGDVGCFASHILVADLFLKSDFDAAVVLEDDAEIRCSADQLRSFVECAFELDMVKLNDWPKCATVLHTRLPEHRLVRYLRVPRGTGSHILTRQGAARLLERADRLATTVDNFVRAEGALALRIGGIVPAPIPQDRFAGSSTDPNRQRNKSRNRKYFYCPIGGDTLRRRAHFLARELGWQTLVRLQCRDLAMRLRRVKRDLHGAYILEQ